MRSTPGLGNIVSSREHQEYQCQRAVNDVPVKEWRGTRFMVMNQRIKAIRNRRYVSLDSRLGLRIIC